MINVYDKDTGKKYGTISDEQLQFMIDQLEEESLEDQDYAITPMTIRYFMEQGADPGLVDLLRRALGDRNEVTVVWKRE